MHPLDITRAVVASNAATRLGQYPQGWLVGIPAYFSLQPSGSAIGFTSEAAAPMGRESPGLRYLQCSVHNLVKPNTGLHRH